jgi:hypothetical protein
LAALCFSWQVKRNKFPAGQELRPEEREIYNMLILIIVLLLVFGVGGGYYGSRRWGSGGGAGIGLGTTLVVLLIAYMLGAFH